MQLRFFNVPRKFKQDQLDKACEFYAAELMHRNLVKNLSIRVVFSKKSGNTTMWEDDNRKPREFTITVETGVSFEDTLLTLAHEMVHVKQYAKGELFDYIDGGPDTMRWLNEKRNWSEVSYVDLPWEQEAYGSEQGLYAKFKSL